MNFPKILVALDFTDNDSSILNYLKYLGGTFSIEEAHFVHVIKQMALPRFTGSIYSGILKQDIEIDEQVIGLLKKEITALDLPLNADNMHCEVYQGRPVHQLVQLADTHKVDLVVVGNKAQHEGSGITSRRMAHRLNSSILFVPDSVDTPIKEVVVLLDYSEHSVDALKTAMEISERIEGINIRVVHTLESIPLEYYSGSLSASSLNGLIRERSLAAYEEILTDNKLDPSKFRLELINQEHSSVAHTLRKYFESKPCDLVIMGSGSHKNAHLLVYGSTTESFVDNYIDSPILVIR